MNGNGIDGKWTGQAKTWSRPGSLLVGVLFGSLFSVLPLELLLPAIPLALIGGALFCLPKSRRYRWSGFIPAVAATVSVMVVAVALPLKDFDHPVGPFPSKTIALGDLVKWNLAYDYRSEDGDEAWRDIRLSLPSERPTRSQIIDCIRGQTYVKAHISRCGNCATLVWGGSFGRISLRPSRKSTTEANQ